MIAIAERPLHVALWADNPSLSQQLVRIIGPMLLPVATLGLTPTAIATLHTPDIGALGRSAGAPDEGFHLHLLASPDSGPLRRRLSALASPVAVLHGTPQAQAHSALAAIVHHAERLAKPADRQSTWRWYCAHCDDAGIAPSAPFTASINGSSHCE